MCFRKILFVTIVFLLFSTSSLADEGTAKVLMKTTKGDIVIELFNEAAPMTVANFLSYVEDGYYDGTIFHRVIKGFMIQGGGFTADMKQKKTKSPITNEADNGIKNTLGTIAMARTPNPHSATSQFFINVVDNDFLDHRDKTMKGWGYCVFGKVVQGLEIVRVIEDSATGIRAGHRDVPLEPVVITQITIYE